MRDSKSERLIYNADLRDSLNKPLRSQCMFRKSTPNLDIYKDDITALENESITIPPRLRKSKIVQEFYENLREYKHQLVIMKRHQKFEHYHNQQPG